MNHKFSLRLRNMQLIHDNPSGNFTVLVEVNNVAMEDSSKIIQRLNIAPSFSILYREYHLAPIYNAIAAYGGLKLLVVSAADTGTNNGLMKSEQKDINIPLLFQKAIRQLVEEPYRECVTVLKVIHQEHNGSKTTLYPPVEKPTETNLQTIEA